MKMPAKMPQMMYWRTPKPHKATPVRTPTRTLVMTCTRRKPAIC